MWWAESGGCKPWTPLITHENLNCCEPAWGIYCTIYRPAKKYGIPVVVAVNRFLSDTPAELELVRKAAVEEGGVKMP